MPTSSVASGFIQSVMLDEGSLAWPSMNNILHPLKQLISTHQCTLKDNFGWLYAKFSKRVHLLDNFMHIVGIVVDINYENEHV